MSYPTCNLDNLRAGLSCIANKRVFVTWKLGPIPKGKDKPPKIAFVRSGELLRGSYASAELQESLMTLDEAIGNSKYLGHQGVGIAFFPGCGVVGLDLDSCVVDELFSGTQAQKFAWSIFKLLSFTEISYSGEGLHAVALGNCNTTKANGELELFGDRNFLALTGFSGAGAVTQVPVSDLAAVTALIISLGVKARTGDRFNDLNDDLTSHLKSETGQATQEDIRSALAYISPDCDRQMWLRIIWGIAHGLGNTQIARDIADHWSSGEMHHLSVKNYAGTADVDAAFDCYDPDRADGITVGTIFKIAKNQGWKRFEERAADSTSSGAGGTFSGLSGDISISDSAPPKRTYVFANRVTPGTLCTLGGSGGASKTMLMMQIAVAMACGKPLGDVQVAEGASLLFLGEEDDAERDRRFGGICEHMSAELQLVMKRIKCFAAAGVDMRLTLKEDGNPHETRLGDEIIQLAKHHAANAGVPVQLIVIDHARLVLGGDPNAADDVTQLTRVLTRIAKETSSVVVLIAHSPKSVLSKEGDEINAADIAGSSAFVDNSRAAFMAYGMRKEEAKQHHIPEDERSSYVRLAAVKANYAASGGGFWFKRVVLSNWEIAVLESVSLHSPSPFQRKSTTALRDRILEELRKKHGGVTARNLRDKSGTTGVLKASEAAVRREIEAMKEAGLVELRKPTPFERKQFKLATTVREVLVAL